MQKLPKGAQGDPMLLHICPASRRTLPSRPRATRGRYSTPAGRGTLPAASLAATRPAHTWTF